MKPVIVIGIICLMLIKNESNAASRFRRYIGGENAEEGQFPYIVSLKRVSNDRHICGGTIIHENFVLTAAHCFKDKTAEEVYITAGSLYSTSTEERYTISGLQIHPDYIAQTILEDLALIKLNQSIIFSENIQKIPFSEEETPIGFQMTVSGWGRQQSFLGNSYKLQYSNVTAISISKCRIDFPKATITSRHICAYDEHQSFCYGDSGGPLVYEGKLIGVVSKMAKNCELGYPNIYVKLLDYLDWIVEAMRDLNTDIDNEIILEDDNSIEIYTTKPSNKLDSKKIVKYWKNIIKYTII